MLPIFCLLTIWAISLEFCKERRILEAETISWEHAIEKL